MAYVSKWLIGSGTLFLGLFCVSLFMYIGLFYRSRLTYMLDLRYGICVTMVDGK